jgi:acetylornithine deacetylase/succinyl-diaminopimelate desuccinylase-like protein
VGHEQDLEIFGDGPVVRLMDDPRLVSAVAHATATDEVTLADQIALTEVPAPPFAEEARAAVMSGLLLEAGLAEVHTDGIGNVLALRPGAADVAPVILSAHLDTVFPPETPIDVRRDGDLLEGPGISDDGRGLAVLLAVARALDAGAITTRAPILFAATVGEEGAGDLRGARHLVGPSGAGRDAAAFISIDGAGLDRVVAYGLGSRRFRLRIRGPGGHSWLDWGLANPIHALGRAVASLVALPLPREPVTTLTVARWGGGTSVNAIPQEAWAEVDCRSACDEHLERTEAAVRDAVGAATAAENARAERGALEADVERIGLRPAGATDPEAGLVRAARMATEAVGVDPVLSLSSTDANAAMAVGIPAITLGGGGEAGGAHTTAEWYRNIRGVEGVARALYTVVLSAGMMD